MKTDDQRIYYVVAGGAVTPYSFCGRNAKRDARRMAARRAARVFRMTGAQWGEIATRRR